MFQNMLQESKQSKLKQNNAKLQLQAEELSRGQSDSGLGTYFA